MNAENYNQTEDPTTIEDQNAANFPFLNIIYIPHYAHTWISMETILWRLNPLFKCLKKRFVYSLQGSVSDFSASNHTAKS